MTNDSTAPAGTTGQDRTPQPACCSDRPGCCEDRATSGDAAVLNRQDIQTSPVRASLAAGGAT